MGNTRCYSKFSQILSILNLNHDVFHYNSSDYKGSSWNPTTENEKSEKNIQEVMEEARGSSAFRFTALKVKNGARSDTNSWVLSTGKLSTERAGCVKTKVH